MKHILQNAFYKQLAKISHNFTLAIQSGRGGFFGDFFMLLNGIQFCQDQSLCYFPDWGKKSLYYDPSHGNNAFFNYFHLRGHNTQLQRPNFAISYWPNASTIRFSLNESPRWTYHHFINHHVGIQPWIENHVNNFIEAHFTANKIVGVHIRRTDIVRNHENRIASKIELYIREINDYLDQYPSSLIYVATDDQLTLSYLKSTYGQQVIFQECLRSQDGNSIHGHYDPGTKGKNFNKGYEVLMDALILSRCNHLIRGHSRVTCYSLCINPELTYLDIDLKYNNVDRTSWLHL